MIKSLLSEKYGGDNVLRVTNIEGLKRLGQRGYQAVIFDDVSMDERSMEEKIGLVDVENDSDIRVLYNTVQLPSGMPRAVLTNRNVGDYFQLSQSSLGGQVDAIMRRLSHVDLKGRKVILRQINEVEIQEAGSI